ncbi:hypothetical protein FORC54_3201 [Vibrio vulnificus]|nr:hypothetical protein FORC54_3201 [Vibrio vulnificus]
MFKVIALFKPRLDVNQMMPKCLICKTKGIYSSPFNQLRRLPSSVSRYRHDPHFQTRRERCHQGSKIK